MDRAWRHPGRDHRGQETLVVPGEVWTVMGPPEAGVRGWLEGWRSARDAQGQLARVWWAETPEPSRRTTPHSLAAQAAGRPRLARIADALGATGLADGRSRPLAELDWAARQRAGVAAALAAEADVLVLDGLLDALDPWMEPPVSAALATRAAEGAAVVVATQRAEVAERWGRLIVLERGAPIFRGHPDALRDRWCRVTVETDDPDAVRALLRPLEVEVTETADGLRFCPREVEPALAQLMRQGWGRVSAWVVHRPSLAEALAWGSAEGRGPGAGE